MKPALLAFLLVSFVAEAATPFRLATFSADVTVPPGHGMMGGAWLSKSVADPLSARGVVLVGDDFAPVVFVSVDWCEIRTDALARWKGALAVAVGTRPERVMVCAIHQHDAPVADLEAERILRAHGAVGTVCDLDFHEEAVQRVAAAARVALAKARPVTHLGAGQAKVERLASNRRFVTPGGIVSFARGSRTTDSVARAAGEGVIDPWLKTLSFWDGDTPLAAISAYSVHPMSYYGGGEVSADFPGLARAQRDTETPGMMQIYASGCSGNTTAGKYNDGPPGSRAVLASRLSDAMRAAWAATTREPLTRAAFRATPVRLEPRDGPGWSVAELKAKLSAPKPFHQCLAAMGLSWRQRADAGATIDIPVLDLGKAALLVLPGEAYVEYQLFAQEQRPGDFIVTAGYGEGATGYIPTEQHIAEGDTNLGDWCWVAPGAEPRLKAAIRAALGPGRQ
ncbi:MAG: hypothetical protein ABMA13_05655 [Chthoniobacteraceae bacterium]